MGGTAGVKRLLFGIEITLLGGVLALPSSASSAALGLLVAAVGLLVALWGLLSPDGR